MIKTKQHQPRANPAALPNLVKSFSRIIDRALYASLFLVLPKFALRFLSKKEVVCLLFAFIYNLYFFNCQLSDSVNMTLNEGKTDM